jgi:hypothetical protein
MGTYIPGYYIRARRERARLVARFFRSLNPFRETCDAARSHCPA